MENQSLRSSFPTGTGERAWSAPMDLGAEGSKPPFPLDESLGYELSPAYRSQVLHLAPGSLLSFILDREGGVELIPIREPHLGWRLRVDEFLLHFPVKAGAWFSESQGREAADRMHHRLLSLGVYYPCREDLLAFWQEADPWSNDCPGLPNPEDQARSLYLVDLVERRCPEIWSALELGCGPGQSLSLLKSRLGIRVAGVEINRSALDLGRTAFPNLTGSSFHCQDFQERMSGIAGDSFELIFSQASLMHLHPSVTEEFWAHLVRVAGRYLITVEDESRTSPLSWPRSYRRLLEGQGAVQTYWEPVPDQVPGLAGFTARVFTV